MSLLRRLLRPRVVFLAAFLTALSLAAAKAALATFVSANCNYNAPTPSSNMYRDGSVTVALVARYEGYHWGGGCWNDNDVDEGPNEPLQTSSTGGEGGDCSGLTFKVWRESLNTGDGGHYQWGRLRNVHGPYTAADFKAGVGVPNATYSKADAIVMDAFASSTHIGMVYQRATSGADQIVEAKCEACGTNIFTRTYRSDSSYGGVRRMGWTG